MLLYISRPQDSDNPFINTDQCQETSPHPCFNWVNRDMVCKYPPRSNAKQIQRHEDRQHWNWNPLSGLQNTFTASDMRFFHHFLLFAYPHLPFRSEEVWKTRLPAYACEVYTTTLSIRYRPTELTNSANTSCTPFSP